MIVGGLLIAASSFAHAFAGWPPLREALVATGVGADLLGALAAGWIFGSVAMLVLGLLAALDGARLRAGTATSLAAARLVGLAYLAFGLAAYVARDLNPHFLGFVALGLLVGLPALGPARRRPA
jgi:hypothetical protein